MADIRILLIEDDENIAELLTTYFSAKDYKILHALDGIEGLKMARSAHPNLILLDVMLPELDGWETARQLRQSALTRYIPIIFLTQRDLQADRIKGLSLGADDYITKPFDITELSLRIKRTIEKAQQEHLYEPRTRLPGGPLIEEERRRLQANQASWQHLQVGINGLSDFRDTYGFLVADDALGLAAKVVLDTVREHGTSDDFVGVADANRLVIFTFSRNIEAFQHMIHERFNRSMKALYNFEDADRGYLIRDEGTPQERHVPLMSLQIEQVPVS